MALFEINGYWKDDKEKFEGYIVSSFNDTNEEDDIFFYGLSEKDLKEAIKVGEKTVQDFVITAYRKLHD
jgi:hypothetical protein